MTPGLVTVVGLTHPSEIVRWYCGGVASAVRGRLSPGRSEHMAGKSPRGTTTTTRTNVISEQEWMELRQSLGLSQLQTEIVRRLAGGKSQQEIARELAIRPRTVRTHTDHICRKFGVYNRVQLVLYVLAVLQELWGQEGESVCV